MSIDKIPVFLQEFENVIPVFTTMQTGIWVGLLVNWAKALKRCLTEL